MALRTSADNAEDVAAGFRMFREPLPEHATEITSLIADLYAISTSLKTLEDLTKNHFYQQNLSIARSDLEFVRASLKYTLEDVVDFFGNMEVRTGSNRDIYKRTWVELSDFFRDESKESLATRVVKYKAFLNEIEDMIKECVSRLLFSADELKLTLRRSKLPDISLMSSLRNRIQSLLSEQENRLSSRLGSVSLDGHLSSSNGSVAGSPVSDRRPQNRRSYERTRPPHLSPQSPLSPSSATFSSDVPPSAPDDPGSPLTGSTTSQSMGPGTIDHWAKQVFLGDLSVTPMPCVGKR